MKATLSTVIVAFNSAPDLARTLPALAGEMTAGDELIVIDNCSEEDPTSTVKAAVPGARIERLETNTGFAAAANRGVELAGGDLVVVLNPDARPESGWGEAIRRPLEEQPDWTAWMALVTFVEGEQRLINSLGNPVHFTGISWAGGHGLPLDQAGPSREVPTASGACLAMPRETWRRTGGFAGEFFLYHEDVDLSLRIRAAGGRIGLETAAVVDHDYEFSASPGKWRWLERNRWATLIRNYPAPLLVLLAPALLATELALLPVAMRGGWVGHKLRSWGDLLRWMPRLLRERRLIGSARTVTNAAFAANLTPDLDSPYIPGIAHGPVVRGLLRGYWRLVRTLLPG